MSKPQRNRLTHTQFYQLCTYLEAHKDALQGRTEKVIQKRTSEDLGFTVSLHHLRSAAETLGADWLLPKKKQQTIAVNAEDFQLLAQCVVAVTKEAGFEVPPRLRALSAGLTSIQG